MAIAAAANGNDQKDKLIIFDTTLRDGEQVNPVETLCALYFSFSDTLSFSAVARCISEHGGKD